MPTTPAETAIDVDHEELPPEPGDQAPPPPAPEPTPPPAALVPRAGGTQLLTADSPTELLEKATAIATALDGLIKAKDLSTRIGNKDHVNIEAWQTLATLLGCAPIIRWTRPVQDPDTGRAKLTEYDVHVKDYEWVPRDNGNGREKRLKAERDYTVRGYSWEACCDVVKDGVILASAEAMVSREEDRWAGADDYAIRSMAQTRAQSRAIAAAGRWVVTLAGYSGTPAEEMGGAAGAAAAAEAAPPNWTLPASAELDKTTKQALVYLLGSAEQASAVYAAIAAEPGCIPKATGQAIVRIATGVQRRQQAARQDAAEAPQPPAAEAEQEGPEPGDRTIGDGPLPGTLPATDENLKRHCICRDGAKDDCPIQGHGIGF